MKKQIEFSKRMLRLIVILWFIGAAFGGAVVMAEIMLAAITGNGYMNVHISELLTYIGTPMSCGIVGYMIKSAQENREKIKGGRKNQ